MAQQSTRTAFLSLSYLLSAAQGRHTSLSCYFSIALPQIRAATNT